MKQLFTLLCLVCCINSYSACPSGQVEVTITVRTDDYGKEGYWQLVPSGNACGTGTIFAGGNTSVGCNGAGQHNGAPGGYPNNSTITEGPWCLAQGSSYDIIFVDDYADGGEIFTVNINGYPVYSGLTGTGASPGSRLTFVADPPPASDLACHRFNTHSYVTAGSVQLSAWIVNAGTDTVHSLEMFYTIDNGTAQTSVISGLNINPFDSTIITSTNTWNVIPGNFTVKIGATAPNGNTDMNASNDTATRLIAAGAPVPVIIDDYFISNIIPTIIGTSADSIDKPMDLDFHPVLTRNELWVVLRGTEFSGGSTVKFSNAGQPNQTFLWQRDDNATHFMDLPSAIAFSENENFATSPSVYDANHDGNDPFTGPSLWSSDPNVYCHTPPGGNGSHLDMLHQSPYSMGICYQEDNSFWVFDNNTQDIVFYDFKKDHGPGNSDHSDGIIRRYTGLGIQGDPQNVIPSHLVLDKNNNILYFTDTDNDRVMMMDITSGTFAGNLSPYEPTAEYSSWSNATFSVAADSALDKPCGIDFIGDRLLVSEYNTGDIIVYVVNGTTAVEMGRIVTGAPGITGIKVGPDGKIWYTNMITNEVVRLDMLPTGIDKNAEINFALYPSPADSKLNVILGSKAKGNYAYTINDSRGSLIMSGNISSIPNEFSIDVNGLSAGIYTISIMNDYNNTVKKFVKQ